jgi:hypothetical protein
VNLVPELEDYLAQPTDNARAFIREVFKIPAGYVIPDSAEFGIRLDVETYAAADNGPTWCKPSNVENWLEDIGEDPEPSEYVGDEELVIHGRWDTVATLETLLSRLADICGDNSDSWDSQTGGYLDIDGLHPMAVGTDCHPTHYNVGGYTPVFVYGTFLWLI